MLKVHAFLHILSSERKKKYISSCKCYPIGEKQTFPWKRLSDCVFKHKTLYCKGYSSSLTKEKLKEHQDQDKAFFK